MQLSSSFDNIRLKISFDKGFVAFPGGFMKGNLAINYTTSKGDKLRINDLKIIYKTYMQTGSVERYQIQETLVTKINKVHQETNLMEKNKDEYTLLEKITIIPFTFVTSRVCSANLMERTPFGDLSVASLCNVVKAFVMIKEHTVSCKSFFINSCIDTIYIPVTLNIHKDVTIGDVPRSIYSYFQPFTIKVASNGENTLKKMSIAVIRKVKVSINSSILSKGTNVLGSLTTKKRYNLSPSPIIIRFNSLLPKTVDDIKDFNQEENLDRILSFEPLEVDGFSARTKPKLPLEKLNEKPQHSHIIFSRTYIVKIRIKLSGSPGYKTTEFILGSSQ